MATFRDFNSLFNHINQNIKETMNDEVSTTVKFEEQKQIEHIVYESYDPFVYSRRRFNNGGLQDIDMMVGVAEIRGDNVVLSVVNLAKGEQEEDLYIAPLIEYGHNEGYGKYQYPFNRDHTSWQFMRSRPFTQATIDALLRSGKHIQSFKQGMKKRGIIVE